MKLTNQVISSHGRLGQDDGGKMTVLIHIVTAMGQDGVRKEHVILPPQWGKVTFP